MANVKINNALPIELSNEINIRRIASKFLFKNDYLVILRMSCLFSKWSVIDSITNIIRNQKISLEDRKLLIEEMNRVFDKLEKQLFAETTSIEKLIDSSNYDIETLRFIVNHTRTMHLLSVLIQFVKKEFVLQIEGDLFSHEFKLEPMFLFSWVKKYYLNCCKVYCKGAQNLPKEIV
jgi:hypothetical protein